MSRTAGAALVAASVILLAASAACGGGTPSEPQGPGGSGLSTAGTASADGAPHPAGQPAEVGGWRAAQTWLVDQRLVIEPGEVQEANVWRVTLVHAASCSLAAEGPPAPPTEPPMPPPEPPAPPGAPTPTAAPSPTPTPGISSLTGATDHCVLLMIANPAASPGVLDLGRDGPVLVTPGGTRLPVAGVRMETDPFAIASSSVRITRASKCSFSAPDAQGRQAADCELLFVAHSNGTTFEQVLVTIGAGKAVQLELAFQAVEATDEAVLEWPGGVRFAAGP